MDDTGREIYALARADRRGNLSRTAIQNAESEMFSSIVCYSSAAAINSGTTCE